jgi:hypothetical protein
VTWILEEIEIDEYGVCSEHEEMYFWGELVMIVNREDMGSV